jgi:integrase
MRNQKEVFIMRWEHVDWTASRYFVYESKTPKGRRWVPLSPRVVRILEKRHAEQDQKARKAGWVFCSKRAPHLTTVAKQFQQARKQAGLPKDLVPYCARHDYGTQMYRQTKNLIAVMRVMGHASLNTTMRYQHQDTDEVARATSQRV